MENWVGHYTHGEIDERMNSRGGITICFIAESTHLMSGSASPAIS